MTGTKERERPPRVVRASKREGKLPVFTYIDAIPSYSSDPHMDIQDAIKKGFLNISDDDAANVLDALYDIENPEERLDYGLELLKTFVPEAGLDRSLDLADIILDANDEIEFDKETESGDGEEHQSNGH